MILLIGNENNKITPELYREIVTDHPAIEIITYRELLHIVKSKDGSLFLTKL